MWRRKFFSWILNFDMCIKKRENSIKISREFQKKRKNRPHERYEVKNIIFIETSQECINAHIVPTLSDIRYSTNKFFTLTTVMLSVEWWWIWVRGRRESEKKKHFSQKRHHQVEHRVERWRNERKCLFYCSWELSRKVVNERKMRYLMVKSVKSFLCLSIHCMIVHIRASFHFSFHSLCSCVFCVKEVKKFHMQIYYSM